MMPAHQDRGQPANSDMLGWIDLVDTGGGRMHVFAWSLFPAGGRMTGARIEIGGEVIHDITVEINEASADVAKAHPGIEGSDSCRMSFYWPLPPAKPLENTYLRITPIHERGQARSLFAAVNLQLPLPDEKLIEGIGGGFVPVAYAYLGYFVEWGRLQRDHSVLDIGCGCGRMAYALGPYLDRQRGRYRGFDIVDAQVAWAAKNLTPAFPNFAFAKVDIYNKYYNPKGRIDSATFRFPHADASFDFAFLTSVFTHMLMEGTIQYLREIARTLKPGGHCMATCFLLNRESEHLIVHGKSSRVFPFALRGCRVEDKAKPEGAVAFQETEFLRWCEEAGLEPVAVRYGQWCGRRDYTDLQDIVVLKKR